MKIACLIHSLGGGGAERVMAGLVNRLSDRGHDVTLMTMGDGSDDRHAVSSRVDRVNLDVMRPSTGMLSGMRNVATRVGVIRRAVATVDPQVLLSFCDRTNVLAALAADGSVPVVLSERSDPERQKLPVLWRSLRRFAFSRRAFSQTGRIVVQTHPAADYFAKTAIPCDVIPSAVDPPPSLEGAENCRQKTVIAIGRLSPEKGFQRLLDAFAIVHDSHPDWRLRILGDGPQQQRLRQHTKERKLQTAVSMPGWTSPVWDELARASVFVLPSDHEGFPSALLEAMAMGVPPIALSDQIGSAAIIRSGENGLLTPSDPAALARAMIDLIRDEPLRRGMGHAAKEVISQFSWPTMTERYLDVMRLAVDQRNKLV